ncbi:hypothetical protein CDIK_3387 [Cucumispora dikerogammari]|nr:hypothetical protein CDIK_3387 [Cucumispora dikerogammari]
MLKIKLSKAYEVVKRFQLKDTFKIQETHVEKMYWRCNKKRCSLFLFTHKAYSYLSETEHNQSFGIKMFNNTFFTEKLKEIAVMNDENTRNLIINTRCKKSTILSFNYVNVRRTIYNSETEQDSNTKTIMLFLRKHVLQKMRNGFCTLIRKRTMRIE